MELLNSIIENIKNLYFWEKVFLGNTLGDYAVALLIFIGLFLAIKILESIILAKLRKLSKKTNTDLDDALIRVIDTISHGFYLFIAFYLAVQSLVFHEALDKALMIILILWVVYVAVEALDELMRHFIEKKAEKEDDKSTVSALNLIRKITKGVLWVIGLLLVLSNLGVNITSLVAGLGIGGVAVALALQNILGDLFSSFSIYFDKPFIPGDLIVVEGVTGTVEKIGIKTTRIRSLKGEEVIISNQKLTNAKIENYKKMDERRIVFEIGIGYETPQDTLKKVPQIIQKTIESTDNTRFDRSHFSEFGDSSLKIETVYYIESQEYQVYKDAHQEILLKIREKFKAENISFPFPTRMVHIDGKINTK